MPRKLKLDSTKAELSAIDALIQESIILSDPVGKMQYEYRKSLLEAELAQIKKEDSKASVALFFGGKPVFGSIGVNADFAGRALNDFQEIISKVFTNLELGSLGTRGPISFSAGSQLMITGVAKGSFGFVLDEISDQMELADTSLKNVVDEVALMIDKTGANEQNKFEEVLSDIDDRTLISLRNFFVNLDKNSATLRLVEGDNEFQLDEAAIHRGRERTENTSIDESEDFIDGVLLGFLPEHRKFELRLSNAVVIYGTATKNAAEAYSEMLTRGISIVDKKCRIKASVRIIKPINRPEKVLYRLLEFIGIDSSGA